MMSEKRDISPHISFLKLEQRLVLLAWLNGHFGYENNRDLLADMKEAAEGFDASGRSYVCHRLESRGDKVKIPLVEHGDKVRMTPPGLNESEAQFVQDMRDY